MYFWLHVCSFLFILIKSKLWMILRVLCMRTEALVVVTWTQSKATRTLHNITSVRPSTCALIAADGRGGEAQRDVQQWLPLLNRSTSSRPVTPAYLASRWLAGWTPDVGREYDRDRVVEAHRRRTCRVDARDDHDDANVKVFTLWVDYDTDVRMPSNN